MSSKNGASWSMSRFWCMGSLGFESVLRYPEDAPDGSGVAIPGPLVKEDGKWTWKPFFASWAEYEPDRSPELENVLTTTETGRSPK